MAFAFSQPGIGFPTRQSPAPAEGVTDEMLVALIADRRYAALQTLYLRRRLYVYRFILRLVKDEAAAEAVLSDVFLDVWREAARFNGRSAVATWLLGIARLKSLSLLRRRRDAELDEAALAELPDPADDMEVVVDRKRRDRMLRDGLAKLSVAHREVV